MSIHTDEMAFAVLSDESSNAWRRAEALAHFSARLRGEAQAEQRSDAVLKRIRGLIAEIDPAAKPATGELLHVANELRAIAALSSTAAPAPVAGGAAIRPALGIDAEWVVGYLPSDAPEEHKQAVRDAFEEFAALAQDRASQGAAAGGGK